MLTFYFNSLAIIKKKKKSKLYLWYPTPKTSYTKLTFKEYFTKSLHLSNVEHLMPAAVLYTRGQFLEDLVAVYIWINFSPAIN